MLNERTRSHVDKSQPLARPCYGVAGSEQGCVSGSEHGTGDGAGAAVTGRASTLDVIYLESIRKNNLENLSSLFSDCAVVLILLATLPHCANMLSGLRNDALRGGIAGL